MWIIFGSLSIICTLMSCLSIFKSQEKLRAYWFSILGLVFTVLTLLAGYQLVSNWVKHEDWSALLDAKNMADVVPSMFTILTIYVITMLTANIIALILIRGKSKNTNDNLMKKDSY